MSGFESHYEVVITVLENYKKRLSDLENDKDFHYELAKYGIGQLTKKISNALEAIKNVVSGNPIRHHREVVSLALNLYLEDLHENEEIFNEKIGRSELFSVEIQRQREKINEVLKTYCGLLS